MAGEPVGRRDGLGSGSPAWRSSRTRLLRYFRRLPANLAGARERAVHCERHRASAKRNKNAAGPKSPCTAPRGRSARRSPHAPLPMAGGGREPRKGERVAGGAHLAQERAARAAATMPAWHVAGGWPACQRRTHPKLLSFPNELWRRIARPGCLTHSAALRMLSSWA